MVFLKMGEIDLRKGMGALEFQLIDEGRARALTKNTLRCIFNIEYKREAIG